MLSKRWTILQFGGVALAAAALAGCQSFKAVQATGAVGAKLADHGAEFSSASTTCYAMAWLGPDPSAEKKCADVQKDAERFTKVADMLASYAQKLSAFAKNDDLS